VLVDKLQVMSDDFPGVAEENYEKLSQHRLSPDRDIKPGPSTYPFDRKFPEAYNMHAGSEQGLMERVT
jgi:hypothetical protein